MPFAFRPLLEDDLPTMHRWLNDPEVVRWWEGDDVTWEVVADYSPSRPDEPVEHWIAADGDGDIGWISCATLGNWPEEAAAWSPHGIDGADGTIDYLVGDAARRGCGVGTAMIEQFVAEIGFGCHPGWHRIAVAPMAANRASWRALEKAGFRFRAVVPDPLGDTRLMVLDRPR